MKDMKAEVIRILKEAKGNPYLENDPGIQGMQDQVHKLEADKTKLELAKKIKDLRKGKQDAAKAVMSEEPENIDKEAGWKDIGKALKGRAGKLFSKIKSGKAPINNRPPKAKPVIPQSTTNQAKSTAASSAVKKPSKAAAVAGFIKKHPKISIGVGAGLPTAASSLYHWTKADETADDVKVLPENVTPDQSRINLIKELDALQGE